MEVLIVGNGPSLLEKKNGKLIDSFDLVIRFNAYAIQGYEDHVGTRTDCWVNTINYQNKDTEIRLKKDYCSIIWHCWQWDPSLDEGFKSFVEHYKDRHTTVFKTKRKTISEIQKYVGDMEYFTYSTGVIAIWMYLKEYPSITITGFDWWKSEKHHYSDKAPRGTIHKPDKEYILIKKLIAEDKVKFL